MPLPCGKRSITLVWCIMECIFFSGLLNGWIPLQDIFTQEHYFVEKCNFSDPLKETFGDTTSSDVHAGLDFPFITIHNGVKMKCVTNRVFRVMTMDEYKQYRQEHSTISSQVEQENTKVQTQNQTNQTSGGVCLAQKDALNFVFFLVAIARNILMLPLGIFLDIYGTSRTRIIAMCCTALGSLTMLFANEVIWLIFPALLMLGISGLLVLLTDLQVSNLFGSRRLTTMSTIVGASFSGGIVIILMKLTREADVSLHTSFMLISVGFVPILISTIVMLPRSRIPWPLPVGYGKNRGTELQGTQSVKGKGWKRRISDGAKKRCDMMAVLPIMKTRLYMCMVVWFSLMSLKSLVFDLNIEQNLLNLGVLDSDVTQYMSVYAICSLFCLPLSPCVGLIMDWNRTIAEPHHIGQMRSILFATWINYAISFMSSVFALFPNYHVQVISYILVAAEKSTFYATFLAFITHVHFPGEHFGKLVGVALAVSGFFLVAQHPLKLLVYHGFAQHTFYMPSIVLIMILVASCHPICVWCHCKTGKINGSVDTFEEDKTGTELMIESHRDTKTDGEHSRLSSTKTGNQFIQITDL